MEQKLYKKRSKYKSILKKDLDIEASFSPTTVRNLKKIPFLLFFIQLLFLFNILV